MNTTIKLLILAAAALAGLNACNQDNERAFYDESATAAYSFTQATVVAEVSADDNGALQVKVARTHAAEAASVQLKFTATAAVGEIFSLATPAITFAAGDYEAAARVEFALGKLALAGQYSFSVAFADPATPVSMGGKAETVVRASRKLTFVNVGTGTYSSAALEETNEVLFERAKESPNVYKLVNCFTNDILMELDTDAGTAKIAAQDCGQDFFGNGTNTWIQCLKGTCAKGVVTFGGDTWDNAFFIDKSLNGGLRMTNEVFTLPANN